MKVAFIRRLQLEFMKTLLAVGAVVAALALGHPGGDHAAQASAGAGSSRVAVLVLENRSWEQVKGNPSAPYLNGLLRRGAVATNYFAITHPSLPNYLALTTGGHQSVKHDCSACRDTNQSLANQLESARISWRAYFEDIKNPLATNWTRGQAYNPHYNPFAYTAAVRASDPVGDVTNFAALRHDLAAQQLPRFSWIAPNVWHDGHSVKLAKVDSYASKLVPRIVRALGPKGVLFVTWDEGPDSDLRGANGIGGGHIPLIAIGPGARGGTRVTVRANHYALLRTIEDHFRLTRLRHAGDASTPSLGGLLRPS